MKRRHSKSAVLVVVLVYYAVFFLLLEGILVRVVSANASSEQAHDRVLFKVMKRRTTNVNLFSRKSFYNSHGLYHDSNISDQDQKRITPNGANPLHNR
ncbi:hypothetical protein PanWU01x14_208690 [Parasponia andersonii]|uniref:Uncharacterized protein n=1 Tax=Parasponia andersonii TaxID=3476 RepID=A0A2P5BUL0_PARAD|nr:hypothetical protein PanWU01x14_208690 [Parasponia andersonii]